MSSKWTFLSLILPSNRFWNMASPSGRTLSTKDGIGHIDSAIIARPGQRSETTTAPLAEPTARLLDISTFATYIIAFNCCVIQHTCRAGHIKGSVVECMKVQVVCTSTHSTLVIIVVIAYSSQATFHFVIIRVLATLRVQWLNA